MNSHAMLSQRANQGGKGIKITEVLTVTDSKRRHYIQKQLSVYIFPKQEAFIKSKCQGST